MSSFVGLWQGNDELPALDGRYRIQGDIRLDARDELISALSPFAPSSAERVSRGDSDAALVLHAYRAWGAGCVDRIHGDFSFAIRDESARRVFCARDRFGVRPFYYAAFADVVLAGNALDALRRHPRVGGDLYEPALADFLVVGNLLEPDRSFFADIRRLPPAHTLTLDDGATPRIERYWSLPVEPELRYGRREEYVEHFSELLSRAVADRCPPGDVTLFLSGGLDSAAIAAALRGRAGAQTLCLGWSRMFADPEPALAAETARALGLPLTVHEFADCEPFKGWDTAAGIGAEPEDDFYRANTLDSLKLAATRAPVALFGRGGDELFARETLADELRRGAGARALYDAAGTWLLTGHRPPLGLRAALSPAAPPPSWIRIPAWLNADWIAPMHMQERLRALDPPDARRPRANARYRLSSARWVAGFEAADAAATGIAVDCRYPFMDERVVAFALRVPPLPWCVDKFLLRQALRPALPDAIVRRRKALLADEPLKLWADRVPQFVQGLGGTETLGHRVDAAAWRRAWEAPETPGERGIGLWRRARVHALARWLDMTRPGYATLRAVA